MYQHLRIKDHRHIRIGSPAKILLAALALGALPRAVEAQFVDTFDTIYPAWVVDRYPPAGFASVNFDGDSCLSITIDQTGSTANRPAQFNSEFYATQGYQRPAGITGLWTLSARVFVSSAFNTTTGPLVCSELWGHTGTTPEGGAYMTLGFTNASPSDPFNPTAADRAFRFEAWDCNTLDWIDLGVPAGFVFDTWHTLSGASTGNTFEFSIDGVLVRTIPTAAGDDLLTAFIEGYNFDQAGSYSVYWDDLIAGVAPVITNDPLTAAGTVGTPFSFTVTASGAPTSYAADALPHGLVIDAGSGAITGTPTAAGVTFVKLTATSASGTSSAVTLTITISPTAIVPTPTPRPTPSPRPSPTQVPSPTPGITPTPSPTPTPTATRVPTPTPRPTPSPRPSPTQVPSPTPGITPTPSPTPTPTATRVPTPTPRPRPTPTQTPT